MLPLEQARRTDGGALTLTCDPAKARADWRPFGGAAVPLSRQTSCWCCQTNAN